jgi:hypothetical protein
VQGLRPGEARLIRPARNRVNGGVRAGRRIAVAAAPAAVRRSSAKWVKALFESAGTVV